MEPHKLEGFNDHLAIYGFPKYDPSKNYINESVDHLALHADATTHGLTLPDVEYRKMSSNDGKVFRGELQDGSHVSFTVPDDRYPDFPRNIRYTHPTRGIHREDGPAIISSKPGRLDIPQVKFYYKDGKQIANFTDGKYKDNRANNMRNKHGKTKQRQNGSFHCEESETFFREGKRPWHHKAHNRRY
jgi:hypothetical protein